MSGDTYEEITRELIENLDGRYILVGESVAKALIYDWISRGFVMGEKGPDATRVQQAMHDRGTPLCASVSEARARKGL